MVNLSLLIGLKHFLLLSQIQGSKHDLPSDNLNPYKKVSGTDDFTLSQKNRLLFPQIHDPKMNISFVEFKRYSPFQPIILADFLKVSKGDPVRSGKLSNLGPPVRSRSEPILFALSKNG
jgi:hypothetical protein